MHILSVSKNVTVVVALLLIVSLTGCSGSASGVAEVTGTITMDGSPLANAVVTFVPTEMGSPSYGRTDQSGIYTLQYTREVSGAVIGEHRVRISTMSSGDPDSDPPIPASPETVPAQYNSQSELLRTVESGSNTIDFELDSQGEIVPIDQQ
jgi:hypothetical protein